MAGKTVNPTRMELTRLKGRLKTASRGHKLLKDKRDEQMRQFMILVRRSRQLRAQVEQALAEAQGAFTVAAAVMSPEMLQQALMCPKQRLELETGTRNIMGVETPVYHLQWQNDDPADLLPYGFAQTSGELDTAIETMGGDGEGCAPARGGHRKDAPPRQRAGIRHDPRPRTEHQVYRHEARGERAREHHAPDEGQGHGPAGRAPLQELTVNLTPKKGDATGIPLLYLPLT